MARNPYAAPAVNVDRVKERERPWSIKTSLALLVLSLAVSVPHVVYRFTRETPEGGLHELELFGLVVSVLIMLALAAAVFTAIWRGRRWGRILYAMVVVLMAFSAISAMPAWFRRSAFLGVTDLLSTVADLAALALLFTPAANAFFRKR